MEEKSPDTLEKIQQSALEEFSEKGFLGASLRQIVKNAGVTTGAFYGYFSSKEALFASLVVESTLRYMEVLRRLGKNIPPLNRSLCHIIASGMFNGLFEIVIHDMPREQAHRDVTQFRTFYTAGWLELMGQ